MMNNNVCTVCTCYAFTEVLFLGLASIGSSGNGSTRYWPPGSLHLWVQVAIFNKGIWLFMRIKILCIEYIF